MPVVQQQLLCINPDLYRVVDEGEERGQGEGRHEHGDEAVLNDFDKKEFPNLKYLLHCNNSAVLIYPFRGTR